MNEQLYRKKGRRYLPIGYSDGFMGFPSDGIWIVKQINGGKSSECIIKYEELESARPAVQMILQYKDKIIEYLQSKENFFLNNENYNDFVNNMLKEITKPDNHG